MLKPHQEHVHHINEFVWRFCVNYVPLNSVTCIIAYPNPHCNSAVSEKFGTGKWMRLLTLLPVTTTGCGPCQPGKTCFSRAFCYQVDVHGYALWPNQWPSYIDSQWKSPA
jgi:hypothetical protein